MVNHAKASTPVPSAQVSVSRDDIADSYARLRIGLLGYLRGRVEDAATAEDLLHAVFLKALKTEHAAKSSEAIAAWLYSIARNTVIDHYRARRLAGELTDDVAFEEVEDASSLQALSLCLLPMAQQLSPRYRDVVLATEFQGKTKQVVASELGLSLSAVKSRASRGRTMLKDRLLACCHVELSPSGDITDHHSRAQSGCKSSC